MRVTGKRHSGDCLCGCQWVEGVQGRMVEDSDTPKLASMDEPMLIATFEVESLAGGPAKTRQVAYSYAELGEAPRLFEPAPEQMVGQISMDGFDD